MATPSIVKTPGEIRQQERDASLTKIKNAARAAAIVAGVTLSVVILGLAGLTVFSSLGLNAWALADVALAAGLGYGIYRKSRICAVIMFVYFVGSKILLWSKQRPQGIPLALVLGYFLFQGIQGTFAYHRLAEPTADELARGATGVT